MRKYKWAVIAGLCVLALIAIGALLVPRLFGGSSGDANEEVVEPGHWWKMTLNEEQAGIWRELWGENITMAQLIEAVWPGILQEIPTEAASSLGRGNVGWMTDTPDGKGNILTMDDALRNQMVFCAGFGLPAADKDTGAKLFFYHYIGTEDFERMTLMNRDPDRTSDMLYRISIYTDDVRPNDPNPSPGTVHL